MRRERQDRLAVPKTVLPSNRQRRPTGIRSTQMRRPHRQPPSASPIRQDGKTRCVVRAMRPGGNGCRVLVGRRCRDGNSGTGGLVSALAIPSSMMSVRSGPPYDVSKGPTKSETRRPVTLTKDNDVDSSRIPTPHTA